MGCHFLLQGVFQTQSSKPHSLCLLHWQADSLPLVPPGKPKFHIFTQDFGAHIDQENPKAFAQGFCSAENRTLKNSSETEFAHANKQLVTIANGCSFPLAAILTETYWAICRRKWQPTSVFLPGKPHGQRSLACYSPWCHRVGHNWARTCTQACVITGQFCSFMS